jgi:hypothetical protein
MPFRVIGVDVHGIPQGRAAAIRAWLSRRSPLFLRFPSGPWSVAESVSRDGVGVR